MTSGSSRYRIRNRRRSRRIGRLATPGGSSDAQPRGYRGAVTEPRTFISHAAEDKAAFAMPLAEILLELGVDAWLDRWEIAPGDSLPRKVFEEGLGNSDIVVVGLSKISIGKAWVREELDVATVRRIEGKCRIVPVILEPDVDVPTGLSHLFRLSVPSHGLEGVADQIVRLRFNVSQRPSLGQPPAYASAVTTPRGHLYAADEVVMNHLVQLFRDHGFRWQLMSDDVQAAAAADGVSSEAFSESMHALTERHLVDAQEMAGGSRWWLHGIPPQVWLREEERSGVDLHAARSRILGAVVNGEPLNALLANYNERTIDAILDEFQLAGLLRYFRVQVDEAPFSIGSISPLARRRLHELDD